MEVKQPPWNLNDFYSPDEKAIVLSSILKMPEMPPFLYRAGIHLMTNQYLSAIEFFKMLSQRESFLLGVTCTTVTSMMIGKIMPSTPEETLSAKNMVDSMRALIEVLTLGAGYPTITEDETTQRAFSLARMSIGYSLHLQNLAELHPEKYCILAPADTEFVTLKNNPSDNSTNTAGG